MTGDDLTVKPLCPKAVVPYPVLLETLCPTRVRYYLSHAGCDTQARIPDRSRAPWVGSLHTASLVDCLDGKLLMTSLDSAQSAQPFQTADYRPQKGAGHDLSLRRRTAMAAAGLGLLSGWASCWLRRWTPSPTVRCPGNHDVEVIAGWPIPPIIIAGRLPMPPAARRAKRGTSAHRREQSSH